MPAAAWSSPRRTPSAPPYLQADYMPEAQTDRDASSAARVPPAPHRDRRSEPAPGQPPASARSCHAEMWAITAAVARSGHNPDLMSSFGDSISDTRPPERMRIVAGRVHACARHDPAPAAGWFGTRPRDGRLQRRPGRQSECAQRVVLVVALGAVLTLVIDLDRPQEGFLRVSQRPLTDVQQWIGTPTP